MPWFRKNCVLENNLCNIKLKLDADMDDNNYSSCDVYIGNHDFLICWDSQIYRFCIPQQFNLNGIEQIKLNFLSKEQEFSCSLPVRASSEITVTDNGKKSKGKTSSIIKRNEEIDFLKLKSFKSKTVLNVDGKIVQLKENFTYGCGNSYTSDSSLVEENLKPFCKITNPSKISPIARIIQRYKDEIDDFDEEQYKLQALNVQVLDGYSNPLEYDFKLDSSELNRQEKDSLKASRSKLAVLSKKNKEAINLEIVSIVLAICYDIRTTENELTCESAWTRNILAPSLTYFESPISLKNTVIAFWRRSLIYPLYRNFHLSRVCISDAIKAITNRNWLIRELLKTRSAFLGHENNRMLLNTYYIENYIHYVNDHMTTEELNTLSKNLKNVLIDIKKEDLCLNLVEIELELMEEIMFDTHLADEDDSDDDSS